MDRRAIAAFAVGVVFALGLGVAQMTLPARVIGFLDVTGPWDSTLVFVMGGAVGVYTVVYRIARRRGTAVLGGMPLALPTRSDIDPGLVTGAALFGVGWGLGGFCPGPAVTSAVTLAPAVLLFVGAMLAGMLLYRAVDSASARRRDRGIPAKSVAP